MVSRGRKDRDVLISGDSACDDTGGAYEGREIFIAVGCQTGKVLVYNVLGLLVYEITMEASVVALDWVGDMKGTSVLSSRKGSPALPISELQASHISVPRILR